MMAETKQYSFFDDIHSPFKGLFALLNETALHLKQEYIYVALHILIITVLFRGISVVPKYQ